MNSLFDNNGNSNSHLIRDRQISQGKDLLNFADWRIDLTKYQTPKKTDGGKLDYIETIIPRAGKPDQKLTKMAPAAIGLPTAKDPDTLIALLTIAKQQGFTSDIVPFSPRQLLQIMRLGDSVESYNRLEKSLERLTAVTLRFEYAWYEKLTAQVEPILTTGILAESKLVRRRGRKARDATPDSYIQWTKHLYDHITAGNLTTIDLDLYFSLKRPGSKALYRHLNKRWHGKRKDKPYERDLRELACGHLGLQDTKFVKRNFEDIVEELIAAGYLAPGSVNIHKVRVGTYRVHFAARNTSTKTSTVFSSKHTERQPNETEEGTIVRLFHEQWSPDASTPHEPNKGELIFARQLIEQHSFTVVQKLLSKAVRATQKGWPQCKYFSGMKTYFEDVLKDYYTKQRIEEQRHKEDLAQKVLDEIADREKQTRIKRKQKLMAIWNDMTDEEKHALRCEAIDSIKGDWLRKHLGSRTDLNNPPSQILDYLMQKRGTSTAVNSNKAA